jgi:hypothetical protein
MIAAEACRCASEPRCLGSAEARGGGSEAQPRAAAGAKCMIAAGERGQGGGKCMITGRVGGGAAILPG